MKNTDKMKNIITFLLVFFTATTVWAEKVIVSGTVVDSNKEPLIGVNVTVKDAPGLGTITDIDGRYRIEIDAYSTLLFSYIGFDTYKVLIKENMKVVNVQMKESSNMLSMKSLLQVLVHRKKSVLPVLLQLSE